MSAQKNLSREEKYQLAQAFTMMIEFDQVEETGKKRKKLKTVKAASVKAEGKDEGE
jgi:hypothetical protein